MMGTPVGNRRTTRLPCDFADVPAVVLDEVMAPVRRSFARALPEVAQ